MEKARQYSALIALSVSLSGPGAAQSVAVPSGLGVERIEVILDEDLRIGRFRFLAPAIAESRFDLRALRPDMDALCREIAAPELSAARPDWEEIVISVSSLAIPFGQADPEVAQSFEVYRLREGNCIWSQF